MFDAVGRAVAGNRKSDRDAAGSFLELRFGVPRFDAKLDESLGATSPALDEAAKTNEEVALAYQLDTAPDASPLEEAHKLPTRQGRAVYLTCCWLEALCTAEARVLGWIYQELYDRPYTP